MQRAYDMIIHDIALQNLNVALCMDRAGLSGDDGPTHHGLFDIGYLRHVPNIVHMQPKDEDEFVDMLWTMANYNSGPIAIRYPRGAGTGAKPKADTEAARNRQSRSRATRTRRRDFRTRQHVRSGRGSGAKLEEQGISVALINPRWIKPIDTGTLEFFARSVEVICTIEDHVLHNGFGCAVMEHLAQQADQHAGRSHRLARPVHRARHDPDPAQETRPHRGRAGGKSRCRFLRKKPCDSAIERRVNGLASKHRLLQRSRPIMSAIEARGLTKIYRTYRKERGLRGSIKGLVRRKYDETRAADDVSFHIEEGELVGFLGPNGAGKTTVLKMLSGLLNPTSGEARVLGFVPWERRNEMKRQFSLLMGQKNALWWDLPAQESLELNRAIYGIERDAFQKVVGGLSELLEVQDKMNVMVRELSLGERMKMELISALIHEPRVLFLDEPTIGLDVVSQKRVREFLRLYNSEHRIVTMLTSHYMQDIEELCDRVIIIDHGKIFFDGPLNAIIDRFSGYKILSLTFQETGRTRFLRLRRSHRANAGLRAAKSAARQGDRNLPAVAGGLHVNDINVQELPVEEVIRQLFGEQTTARTETRTNRERELQTSSDEARLSVPAT